MHLIIYVGPHPDASPSWVPCHVCASLRPCPDPCIFSSTHARGSVYFPHTSFPRLIRYTSPVALSRSTHPFHIWVRTLPWHAPSFGARPLECDVSFPSLVYTYLRRSFIPFPFPFPLPLPFPLSASQGFPHINYLQITATSLDPSLRVEQEISP